MANLSPRVTRSARCNETLACVGDFPVLLRGSTGSVLAQRQPSTDSDTQQVLLPQASTKSYDTLDGISVNALVGDEIAVSKPTSKEKAYAIG